MDSKAILSEIVIFNKYAKYIPSLNRRESFEEICKRNMDMHIKKYPNLESQIKGIYKDFVLTKKILPSMRSMQFAGKPIELSPNRIYNCCFCPIDNPAVFSEIMFLLLGGTGVGYSVQFHHIEKLPPIKRPARPRRFLIGDSIEGWADAIKMLVKAYFYGKSLPMFDYSDIREKGAALVTSGGKAPGPEPLKSCIHKIQMIFERKEVGDQLTSLEVHDVVCHIADAVLAGGIRRAACIALFSLDDEDMLSCKSGPWWELNPQRGRANNSAVILRHRVEEKAFKVLWERIKASGSGEPGFTFSNNQEWGVNPCCFVGDMKLKTESGYVRLDQLVGKKFKAFNNKDELVDCIVWSNGIKRVCELNLHKRKIRCTPDHVFKLENGEDCKAADLEGKTLMSEGLSEEVFSVVDNNEYEEVFDFSLDGKNHWGYVEGVVAHNCEIALRPNQFCNLVEVNVSDIVDQFDLEDRVAAASFLGTLQAGYTDFHYLRDVWKKNTEKDALIGVSATGIASEAYKKCNLAIAAKVVVETNKMVAKEIGINEAARTTCVKPAGTTSLCLGTSSGIHAWFSQFYVRRMKLGKNEPIYKYLKSVLPELLEDDKSSPNRDAFICIPIAAPQGAITSEHETALGLLERIKFFSEQWIQNGHIKGDNSHNVSSTVYIKDHEWDAVADWMWKNRNSYNGLSVLPFNGGTYVQAPHEVITEEKYNEMCQFLKKIDLTQVIELENNTDAKGEVACAGGLCDLTF